jgi:hypothetical protein
MDFFEQLVTAVVHSRFAHIQVEIYSIHSSYTSYRSERENWWEDELHYLVHTSGLPDRKMKKKKNHLNRLVRYKPAQKAAISYLTS